MSLILINCTSFAFKFIAHATFMGHLRGTSRAVYSIRQLTQSMVTPTTIFTPVLLDPIVNGCSAISIIMISLSYTTKRSLPSSSAAFGTYWVDIQFWWFMISRKWTVSRWRIDRSHTDLLQWWSYQAEHIAEFMSPLSWRTSSAG